MKRFSPQIDHGVSKPVPYMGIDLNGGYVTFEDYDNCRQLLSLVMEQPTDMQVALDNAKKEKWVRAEEMDKVRAELQEAREWSAELADIGDRLRGQLMDANDELAKARSELKEYKNKCDFLQNELDAIWERDAGEAL